MKGYFIGLLGLSDDRYRTAKRRTGNCAALFLPLDFTTMKCFIIKHGKEACLQFRRKSWCAERGEGRQNGIHGKRSHQRQCAEKHLHLLAALPALVLFADPLRHGRPFHHRPVRGGGKHHRCLHRQSGDAYDHCDIGGRGDGYHCLHRPVCGRRRQKAGREGHRQHRHPLYGGLCSAGGGAGGPRGPHRPAHLHPGGGRGRHDGLPHHLLHRHPLHHSL